MTFRSKSPARVLEELATLTPPDAQVLMADNIMDASYLRTLLPELARRRSHTAIFYEVKSNLTREHVELLARAGIREIQPGIESLSDDVLAIMKKGVKGLQNVQLLKWCKEAGITPYWNFLWGFPGEPEEEYERMADLVPLLTHLPPPEVGVSIRLDRFSPNYTQAAAFGLLDVKPMASYRHLYDVDEQALARLAYFFDFRYGDGRDVPRYTARLSEAIGRWKTFHQESQLVYLDRGDELVVLDSRPAARRAVTRLAGDARLVYLGCDAIQTRASLRAWLAAQDGNVESIEPALAEMLNLGLMVEDGAGRLLSLACVASSRPIPPR